MATSGTVGRTVVDVSTVIEHAVRRCGVLASIITAEMQTSARENLFLILSDLATKGLQLWNVQKTVYPLASGQRYLNLQLGTTDLQDVLLRSVTSAPADVLSAGVATYAPITSLLTPLLISGVSVTCAAGTYNWVLEGSSDGVIWVQYGAQSITLDVAGAFAFDSAQTATLGFWRVRETLVGTVVPTAVTFNSAATEIPITQLNRDDYALMPNKEFASAQPLQAWYDKQTPQPRLWFWPLPQDATRLCVVWAHFLNQDVGALSNTLAVPQRWLNAVISELAPLVCLELPKELVPPERYGQLMDRAQVALSIAQDAEVDGAPLRLRPNIRGYTA